MRERPVALTVEVRRAGTLLGTAPVSAAPCIEDARFRAVLEGELPNDGIPAPFSVTPLWAETGAPVVAGLRVSAGERISRTYDRRIFAPRAHGLVAELLLTRCLERDDTVHWQVVAREQPVARPARFRAQVTHAPYPFQPKPLPGAPSGSLTITIHDDVLEAVRTATIASPAIEWAGLLTGDLLLDSARAAARVVVAGLVPVTAGRGGASGSHFAFDASTFLAARRALGRGIRGAGVVGWVHAHPPCERCPANPSCAADTIFFSDDDTRVQAVFPSAYMIALVAGKVAERPALEPGVRLYGWVGGAITERTFTVVERQPKTAPTETAPPDAPRGENACRKRNSA